MNRKQAFTLIELLIVVAIIAILAAIAVPNFLEAQTRAKVTRTIANARNTATALEAYRIDAKGALPNMTVANGIICSYCWANRWYYHIALSTPIAYMTSTPEDLFLKEYYLKVGTLAANPGYFTQMSLWDHNICHALLSNPIGTAPGMWSQITETDLNSPGFNGDGRGTLKNYVEPAFHDWGKSGASYMFRMFGPSWKDQTYKMPYDPSNGTVSAGEIFYYN
jgi:prepilin-type N-terminal cleavage/methylation domain-containing protein